mgnify:CR=1 FL=1
MKIYVRNICLREYNSIIADFSDELCESWKWTCAIQLFYVSSSTEHYAIKQ